MMEEGIWLPPSQYEAAFIGTAHGDDEINLIAEAAQRVLSRL
jgi:glutamate-1-semialdehyde 2,1-aminomutase